jgi:hypothetical protein
VPLPLPPAEPEPVMWGYNGEPQTDGNITYEKSNQHQYLWMVNAQPYTFRIHVPPGRVLAEIKGMNTTKLGYPDPSLHIHEVKALGLQFPLGGTEWRPFWGPGDYTFTVETVGFTGGTNWQFYYR